MGKYHSHTKSIAGFISMLSFVLLFSIVFHADAGSLSHTICDYTTHVCSTLPGAGTDVCTINGDCYTPTPSSTPTPSTSATLFVDLSASTNGTTFSQSVSGNAPLTNVSLKATVSGTETGPITYVFNCGDGTPPITISNTSTNPKTVSSVCNYTNAGTYTATVLVQR